MAQDGIGCDGCFGGTAEEAWVACSRNEPRERIVDESHFGMSLRACLRCGQLFIHVFSERIDWAGGNDPQAWIIVPVSAEEAPSFLGLEPAAAERNPFTPAEAALPRRLPPER